jgi:hypothetical protein
MTSQAVASLGWFRVLEIIRFGSPEPLLAQRVGLAVMPPPGHGNRRSLFMKLEDRGRVVVTVSDAVEDVVVAGDEFTPGKSRKGFLCRIRFALFERVLAPGSVG